MDNIKWAVAGTGFNARRFAQGMAVAGCTQTAAVCSRKADTAASFAQEFGFASCFADYEEMLYKAKPAVVYIATPNNSHYDYIQKALDAGVHVLCEKPDGGQPAPVRTRSSQRHAKRTSF